MIFGNTGKTIAQASSGSLSAVLGPIGSIAGNLLGGLISSRGQRAANQRNIALAREQMRFQERMASTQYQRAAKDLEAAGLNRILALGQPAAAPQGARPNLINEGAPIGEGINRSITSALGVRRLHQDIKQSQANIRLTNQQASKTKAEANLVQSQDAQSQAQTNLIIQQTTNESLRAAGITTDNEIKLLDRQIRQLEIPGVQSSSQFMRWLLDHEATNRDYHLQKAYGSTNLGTVQKWLQHLGASISPQDPTTAEELSRLEQQRRRWR